MRAKYWVLRNRDAGQTVPPIDCNPGYTGKTPDEGMLVYRTKAGCEAAAKHHWGLYGMDCYAAPLLGK